MYIPSLNSRRRHQAAWLVACLSAFTSLQLAACYPSHDATAKLLKVQPGTAPGHELSSRQSFHTNLMTPVNQEHPSDYVRKVETTRNRQLLQSANDIDERKVDALRKAAEVLDADLMEVIARPGNTSLRKHYRKSN